MIAFGLLELASSGFTDGNRRVKNNEIKAGGRKLAADS